MARSGSGGRIVRPRRAGHGTAGRHRPRGREHDCDNVLRGPATGGPHGAPETHQPPGRRDAEHRQAVVEDGCPGGVRGRVSCRAYDSINLYLFLFTHTHTHTHSFTNYAAQL